MHKSDAPKGADSIPTGFQVGCSRKGDECEALAFLHTADLPWGAPSVHPWCARDARKGARRFRRLQVRRRGTIRVVVSGLAVPRSLVDCRTTINRTEPHNVVDHSRHTGHRRARDVHLAPGPRLTNHSTSAHAAIRADHHYPGRSRPRFARTVMGCRSAIRCGFAGRPPPASTSARTRPAHRLTSSSRLSRRRTGSSSVFIRSCCRMSTGPAPFQHLRHGRAFRVDGAGRYFGGGDARLVVWVSSSCSSAPPWGRCSQVAGP